MIEKEVLTVVGKKEEEPKDLVCLLLSDRVEQLEKRVKRLEKAGFLK